MQTFAFIEIPKAGKPEKQCISRWVDQNSRWNFNEKARKKNKFICLPAKYKYSLHSPINLLQNWQ